MNVPHLWTPESWPSSRWPNFAYHELTCSHTGENRMDPEFMDKLQTLRTRLGEPIILTSAYRSPTHPVEATKEQPGTHSLGRAVDIACTGPRAYKILDLAFGCGFTGIGVSMKGDRGRFLHLDDVINSARILRPTVWSY